jgi:beta-glucosidase
MITLCHPSPHFISRLPAPAYALGNYPQGERGADVFADLVSEGNSEENSSDGKLNADPNTAVYSEESLVGYRWFDTKNVPVMYPFGYGLTYTSFEYANIKTNRDKYGRSGLPAYRVIGSHGHLA